MFQINVLCVSTYLVKYLLEGLKVVTIAPLASLNAFAIQWKAHLLERISFPLSCRKLAALGY